VRESVTFLGLHDPISAWSHLLAAAGFFVAAFFLFYKGRGSMLRLTSFGLYTFALVFLFSMSGTYHLLPYHTTGRDVLQVLDHAAIWILIAGTFIPIHTLMFRGPKRWGVLALVWVITIPGVILTTVFFSTLPEYVSLTLYLGLGWIGILSAYFIVKDFGKEEVKYLFLGGVAYTIGAVLEFLRWPTLFGGVLNAHDFFHFFVILGASLHWYLIYQRADWPIYKDQIFTVYHDHARTHFRAYAKSDHIYVEAKSLDALKEKLYEAIERKYHKNLPIEKIILRFQEEEVIDMRESDQKPT